MGDEATSVPTRDSFSQAHTGRVALSLVYSREVDGGTMTPADAIKAMREAKP